eukprot:1185980-Pyramimonas_sp.AAC.1
MPLKADSVSLSPAGGRSKLRTLTPGDQDVDLVSRRNAVGQSRRRDTLNQSSEPQSESAGALRPRSEHEP